jgi:hypothetical protein
MISVPFSPSKEVSDSSDGAIYFFCDHIADVVLFRGLAARLRVSAPSKALIAIVDSSPSIVRYDRKVLSATFDKVLEVGWCKYGGPFDLLNALRFRSDVRKIPFQPGSILILSTGRFLISQILLKRLRRTGVTTVWLTAKDNKPTDDVVYDFFASAVFNLYHLFFGVSYVDVHKVRGSMGKLRNIQHRKNPYDLTFFLTDPAKSLEKDEFYYPFDQGKTGTDVDCERHWIDRQRFLVLYNECIEVIRTLHENARLIYIPHPREEASNRAGLDLRGFSIEERFNSEYVFATTEYIQAVYAPWSSSVQSAENFGIRSYWLYRLFAGKCLDAAYAMHLDRRFERANPAKFIQDISTWKSGGCDYTPKAALEQSRVSTDRLLERVLHFKRNCT